MKYIIEFREDALADFEEGFSYYEKIAPDLADKFYREFKEKTDEIEQSPLHYQIRYRGIRIAFTKTFPFGIHFIVEGENIYVLRVLHTRSYYS